MFIKVDNILIKNVNNVDKNGSYTIKGNDGTGNIDIRVDGRLDKKIPRDKFKNGFKINVTACLSSFNNKNQLMLSSIEIGRATRLNSSHANISYAVFCLKKKK